MAAPPLSLRIFKKYDTDNSGKISTKEFGNLCYELGHKLTPEQVSVAIKQIDRNSDGTLSYEEFKQWWSSSDKWGKLSLNEEQLEAINRASTYFRFFDKDSSGVLDGEEFKSLHADLVKNGLTQKDLKSCLDDLDTNRDGKIDFNEYMDWLCRIGSIPVKVL